MNSGSSASDGGGGGASEDPFRMDHPSNTTNSQHELPFLITHWLANYETVQGTREHEGGLLVEDQQRRKDAFEKINRATFEIASAFSELGAYGTTSRVSVVVYICTCTFYVCMSLSCLRAYVHIYISFLI